MNSINTESIDIVNNPFRLRVGGIADRLFDGKNYPQPFAFTEEVAAVFDDMVVRSVPQYEESIRMLCKWISRKFVEHTRIYDLGSSTGTTIAAILDRFDRQSLEIVAVDNSAPMLEMAQRKLSLIDKQATLQLVCEDVADVKISGASVVIMNYTLQFIPVERRVDVLKNIWRGLNPGGMFFLS